MTSHLSIKYTKNYFNSNSPRNDCVKIKEHVNLQTLPFLFRHFQAILSRVAFKWTNVSSVETFGITQPERRYILPHSSKAHQPAIRWNVYFQYFIYLYFWSYFRVSRYKENFVCWRRLAVCVFRLFMHAFACRQGEKSADFLFNLSPFCRPFGCIVFVSIYLHCIYKFII